MRALVLVAAALIGSLSAASALDKPVPKAELQKLIVGKSVAIGNASASYGADGQYFFNGGSPGKYRIDTGRICVDFDNGRARCDNIVKDAGNYYLIDNRGNRNQFRP